MKREQGREGQKQAVNGLGAAVSPATRAKPGRAKASSQWTGAALTGDRSKATKQSMVQLRLAAVRLGVRHDLPDLPAAARRT